ncbi:MAG TPA: hypothetical protein VFM18_24310 [Methanosarcina sp.]|nr:hypothetical protein [Methanosarcina sp.]
MSIKNTNTRIGTSKNLETGGTYDLLMISYPDGFPEGRITFDLGNTPRKITGVQKVAQTFVKTLLTSKGSDVIYPLKGTTFLSVASGSNIIQNDTLLYSELITAVKDAEDQVKRTLNTVGTDTSSMLNRVDIAGLDVSQDSVVMYITVQTMDGLTANVAVPFPELDLN